MPIEHLSRLSVGMLGEPWCSCGSYADARSCVIDLVRCDKSSVDSVQPSPVRARLVNPETGTERPLIPWGLDQFVLILQFERLYGST